MSWVTEPTQSAADAEFHVGQFAEWQLTSHQRHSYFLRANRFAVNRPKPAHPDQRGDAACILAIGLDRHRRPLGPDPCGGRKIRNVAISNPAMS
jgi:hypothetical protein